MYSKSKKSVKVMPEANYRGSYAFQKVNENGSNDLTFRYLGAVDTRDKHERPTRYYGDKNVKKFINTQPKGWYDWYEDTEKTALAFSGNQGDTFVMRFDGINTKEKAMERLYQLSLPLSEQKVFGSVRVGLDRFDEGTGVVTKSDFRLDLKRAFDCKEETDRCLVTGTLEQHGGRRKTSRRAAKKSRKSKNSGKNKTTCKMRK